MFISTEREARRWAQQARTVRPGTRCGQSVYELTCGSLKETEKLEQKGTRLGDRGISLPGGFIERQAPSLLFPEGGKAT